MGKKGKRVKEREEDEAVVKRICVNTVSVEAFDIFSQVEMSDWDSCGVDSDGELGAWSCELVSCGVCVPSSSAVELVEDGDPSGSVWEFVSECGSVTGSDVPVLAGVGVSAPSVVTVVCEDAPSGKRSLFLSPRSVNSLVWRPGRHESQRNASQGLLPALKEG